MSGCGDKRCRLRIWVDVWEGGMAGMTMIWWWVVRWGSCVTLTYGLGRIAGLESR